MSYGTRTGFSVLLLVDAGDDVGWMVTLPFPICVRIIRPPDLLNPDDDDDNEYDTNDDEDDDKDVILFVCVC